MKTKFETISPDAVINAASEGQIEIVTRLLDQGADINHKDRDGWNALMLASQWGHTEICKLLLNRGADINAKDNNGCTALILAAKGGETEIVTLLLYRGADIDAKNNDGDTALETAWKWGRIEMVSLFLGTSSIPLLYLSLMYGNLPATEMVIDSDSTNLNECLRIAVFVGRENIVQDLLERGANPLSKNIKDQTALHIACARGHAQTLTLLMNKIIEREEQAKYSEGINCFSFWGKESQVNQLEAETEAGSSSSILNPQG